MMTHKELGCSKKVFRKALVKCQQRINETGFNMVAGVHPATKAFIRHEVNQAKGITHYRKLEALNAGLNPYGNWLSTMLQTNLDLEGGSVFLREGFLSPYEQQTLWAEVAAATWRQEQIRMMGFTVPQPRLTTAWVDDPSVTYTYSGLKIVPEPLTEGLATLLYRLEQGLNTEFNYILGNQYRSGSDSIGFHADDEPELGDKPIIASVSLGGPRRFVFKHKRKKMKPVSVTLTPGSLLVMSGDTQKNWYHGIPKTAHVIPPRINLTFRKIVTP